MTSPDIHTALVGPEPRIAVSYVGAGPLVVFLHGIGGNRTNWHDQLSVFGSHFVACAYDARGYGDSDDYDGRLQFADFSHDLARVLDFFCAARAHLVGLSLGGRVARDFFFRHPGRVASLTLCNTSPGFAALPPEQVATFMRKRAGPLMAGAEPADIAPSLARELIGRSAMPGAYERLVESMSQLRKAAYLKTIEASVTQDRDAALEEITVPTHVVASDEDTLYPPSIARDMAARIPGARLTVLPGAGHVSNLEQPRRFNAAVLGFLLEHRGAAESALAPVAG